MLRQLDDTLGLYFKQEKGNQQKLTRWRIDLFPSQTVLSQSSTHALLSPNCDKNRTTRGIKSPIRDKAKKKVPLLMRYCNESELFKKGLTSLTYQGLPQGVRRYQLCLQIQLSCSGEDQQFFSEATVKKIYHQPNPPTETNISKPTLNDSEQEI